jgi:SAM-dependent methyltransferase
MTAATTSSSTYAASNGAAYERFIGRWTRRLAHRVVEGTMPYPDGPLLDVGCGTGSVAVALKARHPEHEIVGIDTSQAYLDFASRRSDASGCRFVRQDACALDWPDGSFAASLAVIVLNFVTEPDEAAREMRRVTRPGGVVVAAGWDFRGGLVYQRMLWDTAAVIDEGAAERRARLFSGALAKPDGLLELWHRVDLEDVRRTSVTIRMDFANFADYWEPLLGGQGPVGSYVAGLPADKQTRIRQAVEAAFLAGDEDGPRSLTATAWVVRGRVPTARQTRRATATTTKG